MNIVEQYQKFHKFSLSFYAADPWFYGAEKDFKISEMIGQGSGDEYYQFTITNGFHTNMVCRFSWEPQDSYAKLYESVIKNLTTGQKITFPDSQYAPPIYQGEKFTVDFDPDHLEAYIETTTGTYKNGTLVIDWLNTDRDFLLVPGDNIMDFNDCTMPIYSWSTDGHMYVKPRFMSA